MRAPNFHLLLSKFFEFIKFFERKSIVVHFFEINSKFHFEFLSAHFYQYLLVCSTLPTKIFRFRNNGWNFLPNPRKCRATLQNQIFAEYPGRIFYTPNRSQFPKNNSSLRVFLFFDSFLTENQFRIKIFTGLCILFSHNCC